MTELAYVCGTGDDPLVYSTIGAALARTAADHGDRDAVVVSHQNRRLSWAELDASASRIAAGLLALGLQPGDRIGIWAPNCLEWVLTQFATARAGLVMVCVNPAYRISELEFALNKVGCRALVTAEALKSSNYIDMLLELAPELASAAPGELHAQRLPDLRWVISLGDAAHPGCLPFADLDARPDENALARLREVEASLQPDDPINIQFTSGTTGSPKGATLTHFNILNNGMFTARTQRLDERDRLCIPVPLYHCFGMVMGVLGCVRPSSPSACWRWWSASAARRCTAYRPCSSHSWSIHDSPNSTCRACVPASWRERPARWR